MRIYDAISLSAGIAVGEVTFLESVNLDINRKTIDKNEIDAEKRKLKIILKKIIAELDYYIKELSFSRENREILQTHKQILSDESLSSGINELIKNDLLSLEQAIAVWFNNTISKFAMKRMLADRIDDMEDIKIRLLTQILDKKHDDFANISSTSIIYAKKLTPSFIIHLFNKKVGGIYLCDGSRTSHATIIARSINLPMITGVKDFEEHVENGQKLIIDSNRGRLILEPDNEMLDNYKRLIREQEEEKEYLETLIPKETKTKDNKKIKLMSNIEIPEELAQVIANNSDGIGLFRTEFLFMEADILPTEEEQYEIYKEISEKLYPKTVVIRTIDVGGDKFLKHLDISKEKNPYLGFRGIRISLKEPNLFKHQIKAILRANHKGNLQVMFPMISDVNELRESKAIIDVCKKEMQDDGISFFNDIKIGAMIEIPSAALTSDTIAKECDFLSIGTNDLVQYTLAVDRNNVAVHEYYQPAHPAVIKLISLTIKNAQDNNIPVAVCGELAADKKFIPLLIGLGIKELSVNSGVYLKVKNQILGINEESAQKLANIVKKEENIEIIHDLLKK